MSKVTCNCQFCNKSFTKFLKDFKKSKNHFCSRFCYNESKKGKEPEHLKESKLNSTKKEYFCNRCNKSLGYGYNNIKSKKFCNDCNKNFKDWSKITIKEFRETHSINEFHARLRQLSRSIYNKSNKPKKCCNCNYDKHYEVCHLKDVKNFNESSSIADVNHIDNLIALCRNCHWEFDNNLIPEFGVEPKESNL